MANRLEETIWNEGENAPVEDATGISHVIVNEESGEYLTSSITEAHRLNSPYILENKDDTFLKALTEELEVSDSGPIDRSAFCRVLLKYDINSLLHGVFLAKSSLAGGRLRLARAISSFIEAENVVTAASGGVKNDHINPKGDAAKGFGNVPFHREEYTAEKITAYFSVDLQQIRSYGLSDEAVELLTILGLYKIRSVLQGDMRLRTACDLEPVDDSVAATKPEGFALPSLKELGAALQAAIGKCKSEMVTTTVSFKQ